MHTHTLCNAYTKTQYKAIDLELLFVVEVRIPLFTF
jgi:hypothetical protein